MRSQPAGCTCLTPWHAREGLYNQVLPLQGQYNLVHGGNRATPWEGDVYQAGPGPPGKIPKGPKAHTEPKALYNQSRRLWCFRLSWGIPIKDSQNWGIYISYINASPQVVYSCLLSLHAAKHFVVGFGFERSVLSFVLRQ